MKKKTNLEAAFAVLSKSEGPLHLKEITKIAIKEGLLESSSKNPATSLGMSIREDIRNNGENSKFYRFKPGFYVLRSHVMAESPKSESVEKKTNKEAAIAVLLESKKPLRAEEITKIALKEGFLEGEAKNPATVMGAILSDDIKKHKKKSAFYRPKPAHFDLISRSIYMKPVVYIMTNIAMPYFVKVGKTSRGRLKPRLRSMFATSSPLPFELFYAAEVEDAFKMEGKMKTIFEHRRAHLGREFYIINPEQIKTVLELVAVEEIKLDRSMQDLSPKDIKALERAPEIIKALQKNKKTD